MRKGFFFSLWSIWLSNSINKPEIQLAFRLRRRICLCNLYIHIFNVNTVYLNGNYTVAPNSINVNESKTLKCVQCRLRLLKTNTREYLYSIQ